LGFEDNGEKTKKDSQPVAEIRNWPFPNRRRNSK